MIQSKSLCTFTILLFLFALSCVSSLVYCATPTETQITLTQEEYRTLNKNLLQLDKNNQELSNKIEMLNQQSNVVSLSMNEQSKQLVQAENLMQEQANQLELANQKLIMQSQSLNEMTNSLKLANQYLNEQKKEIEKAKTQQRNSKLLNILLSGAVIYLAVKN
ncbi:hypothetical protein [Veillonella montpellierensis]|uniref:hypothetical protein n=1 Tax=Veillonella montpellierensis TaxID=187328 RepID=UPI0023F94554|nr:hypothetical protein [Veillonella montpellierensis]